jgi:hypothetical protein
MLAGGSRSCGSLKRRKDEGEIKVTRRRQGNKKEQLDKKGYETK